MTCRYGSTSHLSIYLSLTCTACELLQAFRSTEVHRERPDADVLEVDGPVEPWHALDALQLLQDRQLVRHGGVQRRVQGQLQQDTGLLRPKTLDMMDIALLFLYYAYIYYLFIGVESCIAPRVRL